MLRKWFTGWTLKFFSVFKCYTSLSSSPTCWINTSIIFQGWLSEDLESQQASAWKELERVYYLIMDGRGAGTKGIGIVISIFQLQVLTILDCRVARTSQRSIIPSLCLWAEPHQVIPDWWDATSLGWLLTWGLPTKCVDWNSQWLVHFRVTLLLSFVD